MKETIIDCPELRKGYHISIAKLESLLPHAPFIDIRDGIAKGTCLAQTLALGRAYLQAENKEKLGTDFFIKALHDNINNILKFHAIKAWADADLINKPSSIVLFSSTFPPKVLFTDSPTFIVESKTTQMLTTQSFNIRTCLEENPCLGLSLHPDSYRFTGHILFIYKIDGEHALLYDSDTATFIENTFDELEKLVKHRFQKLPEASISCFNKLELACHNSSFFKRVYRPNSIKQVPNTSLSNAY